MSLEMLDSEHSFDIKSDVYSYSIILYQLFTEKATFEGVRSLNDLTRRVLAGDRTQIPTQFANIPESRRQAIIHGNCANVQS